MNILISSFKQSLKSAPFVWKNIHFYFGFYFIAFVVGLFLSLSYFLPPELDSSADIIYHTGMGVPLLTDFFLCFMVPYYTYKHSNKSDIRPFWTFIGDTFWPIIWNYIKVFFIILFFLILLIIPGIYKLIRYSFVSETIFFDNLYKQGQISALRGSDKLTRGYFWPIFVVFIVLLGGVNVILYFLTKEYMSFSLFQILYCIFLFYYSYFTFLFRTHLYFELKKQKGESISCWLIYFQGILNQVQNDEVSSK